jgi:hypothetical protein
MGIDIIVETVIGIVIPLTTYRFENLSKINSKVLKSSNQKVSVTYCDHENSKYFVIRLDKRLHLHIFDQWGSFNGWEYQHNRYMSDIYSYFDNESTKGDFYSNKRSLILEAWEIFEQKELEQNDFDEYKEQIEFLYDMCDIFILSQPLSNLPKGVRYEIYKHLIQKITIRYFSY